MTSTTDTLIAQRVLVRDMPDRSRIVATLRIHHPQGNAHPYFSSTCDVYEAHGTHSGASRMRAGRDMDSGGASDDAILRAFPGAAAFVRMHLSDWPNGEPMHAEANGFYYLTAECAAYEERHGYDWMAPPLHRLAALYRIADVRSIPYGITAAYRNGGLTEEHRDMFRAFYEAQRDRWAAEARAARELLELMPDTTDLRGYDMYGEPCERLPLPAWLIGADPENVNV